MDTKMAEALVEIMKKQQTVIHEQQEKMAEKFQENFKELHEIMQPSVIPSAPVYEKIRQTFKTDIASSFTGVLARLDKIETDLKILKHYLNNTKLGWTLDQDKKDAEWSK